MGRDFAASLIEGEKESLTVGLIGELGAGKTTFVQGFAEGLGITKRVISPTYVLVREYEVKKGGFENLYHVDLYRLTEDVSGEAGELGIFDIWGKDGNIVLIEWAEKIADIIPDDAYKIEFDLVGEKERKIAIDKK